MTSDDDIFALGDSQLDELQFGVIRVDLDGVILFVNRAELLTTNRRREETVGLNYFSDVAPCAAVKEFQGRFIEFIAARDERRISFGFFFIFGWEHNEVKVTLHKHGADASHVYITTEITAVSET